MPCRELEVNPVIDSSWSANDLARPTLPEGFSSLTSLTKLDLSGGHDTFSLRPIMDLPKLEHLYVEIDDEPGGVAGLPLQSSCLTKLEVTADCAYDSESHGLLV